MTDAPEAERADAVFEGGGVKGLAFAGAIAAAKDAGVKSWVNVAGTSAGAIVAALLVAGYDAAALKRTLEQTPYSEFADYGWGGKWLGAPLNALRLRGIAPGKYFRRWLAERFEESDLANPDPRFGDITRKDLPPDLPNSEREKAQYRLKVIASDVTAGRMLVLPDDIEGYVSERGEAYTPNTLPLVDAVRMSMSFPFFFDPVTLYRGGKPHLIVDGGLLSNFPVWLFDSDRRIGRRTWGFRLHSGEGEETPPYREIPRPFWALPLAKAMFLAATEAWDQRMSAASEVRTVSIPTGDVPTLKFELSDSERDRLYQSGYDHAQSFFSTKTDYMNSYGKRASGPAAMTRSTT